MTDGPYDTSIRGPGENALGGIWSLLNSIIGGLDSLPQIAADIAIIRADVRKVVGDVPVPAGYAGLANALGFDTLNGGASLLDYFGGIEALLSGMTGKLGTVNAPHLLTLRNTLSTMQGSPASNLRLLLTAIEAVNVSASQIASSIGNASTSTPNFTALAWLALIANSTERSADCCEQVPVVPVVPLNPPPGPDFGCGLTNGPLRVTSFIKRVSGDGLPDTYTAQFAGLATASNSLLVNVPAAVPYGEINVIKAIQSQGVCLEWNLTERATPIIGRRRLLGANTDIPGPSSSTFNPTATQGTFAFFPLNANEHLVFELDVVAGGPAPTLNYFLKWQTVTT